MRRLGVGAALFAACLIAGCSAAPASLSAPPSRQSAAEQALAYYEALEPLDEADREAVRAMASGPDPRAMALGVALAQARAGEFGAQQAREAGYDDLAAYIEALDTD